MEEMVSIIVPVYMAKDYIAQTIDMVRKQTYKNWELILVEDCSPDGSAEIIQSVMREMLSHELPPELSQERFEAGCTLTEAERICLIRKDKNEGAAKARNDGIERAKGRYIAFLDADDVWLPDKLEKELAFIKDKQAAFVFTAYEFGDEDAQGLGKVVAVPERLTYRKALSRTVIFTSTVMFDMSRITKELILMPEVESEDTAAWWRILRAGYVAYGLNEALVIYRRPKKSLSSNKFKAMKRIWNLYRKEEGLTVSVSAFCFCLWAVRATMRRI